ncbi:MAG: aminopeptidase, partial [Bacteroidales bacterium]|nr:aminopeptidase [Candidatus Equibacterium intestinale]
MKRIFTLAAVALTVASVSAQAQQKLTPQKEYQFTTVKENPVTSVKDQASSGTCWCFSTISFLESEILRNGYKGDDLDLSEMFIVSKAYQDKADKYIRLDGCLNFAQGSNADDVLHVWRDYGIVPNSVMPGLNYGESRHRHSEMEAGLKGYLSGIVKNPNKKLTPVWKAGFVGILNAYLGECPEEFEYNGKKYTPREYADKLGINPDDYVSITSFTHHPFYSKFILEVPDNWRWDSYYNVPLEDMMAIMYNAIENGYTIAWGTDCSESGFTRDGLGINPDLEAVAEAGSDQARWVGVSPEEKAAQLKKMNDEAPEMTITQEMRQVALDNKTTTDDHGMHIYGLAKDQDGTMFFIVKNSWGETGKYKGIWYVSDSFV